MADKDFDSIEALLNTVKLEISEVLSTKVYENIKKTELEHIKSDVYDVYPERKYVWRTENGIDDPDGIVMENGGAKIIGNEIELSIVNEAYPVGVTNTYEYLDELLEFGVGIDTPYGRPRPFIENTEIEIKESKLVEKCLKEELDYIE